MIVSSEVEVADIREAERLSKYAYAFILHAIQHSHLWIIGFGAVTLSIAALLGHETGSWNTVLILYGTLALAVLVRTLAIFLQRRRKARKMNFGAVGLELTLEGIRFHLKNRSVRLARWETYIDARVGERVLILYFCSTKRRFRKKVYLIVPIHQFTNAARFEVLSYIPERIRSESVRRALAQWKLS